MRIRSPKIRRLRLAALALALAVSSSTGLQALASGGHGGENPSDDADAVSAESTDGKRAINLGEFNIRVYHTVASRKDTVSFVLHATVGKDEYSAFKHLYDHRKHKVRDQVIVATRLVPIDDYDDPELKKFRRRILLRLRRSLPELPMDDVYLSDFSLMSQST